MNRFYGLKFAQMQGTPGIAPGTEPVSSITVPKDKRVPTTEAAPAPAYIMPPAPERQHQPLEAKFAEG